MACDALRHSAPPPLHYSTCLLPVQPARESAAGVGPCTDEECVRNGNASWSDVSPPRLSPLGEGRALRARGSREQPAGPTTAVLVVATRLAFVEKLAKAWPSWDELFLDAKTWVILQVDPSRVAAARVVEALQLRAARVGCRRLSSPTDTRYTRRQEVTTSCCS